MVEEDPTIDTFEDDAEFKEALADALCADRMDNTKKPPQCGGGDGTYCYNYMCNDESDEDPIGALDQGSTTLYLGLQAMAKSISTMWEALAAANAKIGDLKFGTDGRIEMTLVDGKPTLLYTENPPAASSTP